ncbi:hypothetical protein APHAL10511_005083 [Amanita phalloides]|nr:hypothetical protein APHAL10511_005083 [Amanita phalloides]
MPRAPGRTPKLLHHRQKPSSKNSNALGYAKRQSRKTKTSTDDVYEYVPGKHKRSGIRLELARDEGKEFWIGPDGEFSDGGDRELSHAQLVGEVEDDEVVASNDDEEVDSDAAFEKSDEERFAEFFSDKKVNKKKLHKERKSVHFADVDLNEDNNEPGENTDEADDEEMEGDDEEFISLVEVLDGKAGIDDAGPASEFVSSKDHPTREICCEDEADDESDNAEKESSVAKEILDFTPSDDEAAPEALDELENFITSLQTSDKKRKNHPNASASAFLEPKHKKRQIIKERTEAGAESEFRTQSSGSKLRLEDLLAPLASQSSALRDLKKSTKALSSESSKYGKTLSTPLPQRSQERLDREAAYEQTKQEVDKWRGTMKRIREAEHLSFPLQHDSSMCRTSNLELTAKFKPSNELESAVDALLKAANMRDEAELIQTEDQMLLANKLTLEEVAERRAELMKMRDLMFRAELKARRINKIKSRAYRRLKRKDKDRMTELSRDAVGDRDGEDDQMKRERERATERATLRHKHTGKWARQMKARGDQIGDDERREMEDMLTRGERLRRKVQGMGSDESDGDEESDGESSEGNEGSEGALEKIKQSAFNELQQVNEQDEQLESNVNRGKKSVFNMKFMKEAMAREKAKTDKVADDFLKELGGINDAEGVESGDQNHDGVQEDSSTGVISQRVGGRVMLRPGARTTMPRPIRSLQSDASSVTLKSTDVLSPPPSSANSKTNHLSLTATGPSLPLVSRSEPTADDPNPWLTRPEATETTSKVSRKNEVVVSKDSRAAEKSKNKLRKLAKKRGEEKERADDDATLEIESENILTVSESNQVLGTSALSVPVSSRGSKGGNVVPTRTEKTEKTMNVRGEDIGDNGDDSDANSEIEAQERALGARTRGAKAFQQRDLVALAFAGDNVVQQFEQLKRREIAADAPQEVDTTIPGWGTWGGIGIRKVPPQPSRIKKIPGIDPTTRADYNKKHVIISERRDKKAAKYMVKDLPFPYTSKAQFERSIETPLGAEWNTRVGFQRATLPRVVTKPGVVIMPLKKFS